jgi:glucosamine--fructose-6-phosphate aminotransferase (isomerizing)
MEKGHFTHEEIFSQTKAWEGALNEVDRKKGDLAKFDFGEYQQIIFTGCGSTYYLSLAMAALFQSQTGMICKAVPAGEIMMNPSSIFTQKPNLLFALSRSASTSETVRAITIFKDGFKGNVITVSNYPEQPFIGMSDLPFIIKEGQEESVAQTRSFSSMLVAATAVTMLASHQERLLDDMTNYPRSANRSLNAIMTLQRALAKI